MILSLHHHYLPPSIHSEKINPRFSLQQSPLYINTVGQPWDVDEIRHAGISSFGFGGTNVHIVLSEFEKTESSSKRVPLTPPSYNRRYLWPDRKSLEDNDSQFNAFFDKRVIVEN